MIRIIHNEDLYKFVESLRIKYPGFKIIGTTAHHEKPIYHEDLKTPRDISAALLKLLMQRDFGNQDNVGEVDELTMAPQRPAQNAEAKSKGRMQPLPRPCRRSRGGRPGVGAGRRGLLRGRPMLNTSTSFPSRRRASAVWVTELMEADLRLLAMRENLCVSIRVPLLFRAAE